ncbi:hopanoid-associated sugar epimerase [Roseospira visakhapatnamensis]|uniref:Dihydroflavonol-4-reductase n=1 Tax=Roseospira visakhapatnamensis TaxID=390880 RepID=A0A7W6RF30_9PROT|nr:hopanoid-associated sugar epimerase [Roseospira visakhapatnamensis]MBB4266773.1 dihydroflavonol-4-reductase [Roseospira visakhapatnamensis]
MTTLVTGATGFVGAAVTRALLARGEAVRCLARSGGDRRNLDGLDVEVAEGDLTDPASLRAAARGCDALYHVAADYRLWIPDPPAMDRVNVDGSRAVIRAALEAGARRAVYTSSVAVLRSHADGTPADEDTPTTEADMIGAYKRSKYRAEAAVAALVRDEGAPVVIVNPSTPIGPRDVKPTPTGRVIVEAAAGRMPAYVDTGLNVAHVDDVAAGHLLAFDRGAVGARYILGGEDLTLARILAEVAALVGRRPPTVRLPHDLILPFARVAEGIARVTGKEPFATVDGLRMAKKRMFFSSAKAARDLGYAWRPARAALADAVAWFQDNGYVR